MREPGTARNADCTTRPSRRRSRARAEAGRAYALRSAPRPSSRTETAPFSAMTPATGSVRAQASANPAGRPVTSTTATPERSRRSSAPSVEARSRPAVVSVPSTSVNTASTRERSASWSGRSSGIGGGRTLPQRSLELEAGQQRPELLGHPPHLLGGNEGQALLPGSAEELVER